MALRKGYGANVPISALRVPTMKRCLRKRIGRRANSAESEQSPSRAAGEGSARSIARCPPLSGACSFVPLICIRGRGG